VPAQGVMAGFWRRLVALLIDGIVLGIVAGIISGLIGIGVKTDATGTASMRGIVEFILGLIYFGYFWSSTGQSLGYMVMGMRVTRVDGAPIGAGRAVGRFVLIELSWALCAIPAIVSAFMVGLSENKRAIHDLMADTVVVRT
jgi:uncharacterized RDD family membrane protein YckC